MNIVLFKNLNYGALNGKPYKTGRIIIHGGIGNQSFYKGFHKSFFKETLTTRKINHYCYCLNIFSKAFINFIVNIPEKRTN